MLRYFVLLNNFFFFATILLLQFFLFFFKYFTTSKLFSYFNKFYHSVIYGYMLFYLDYLSMNKFYVYGDYEKLKQTKFDSNVINICNHLSSSDWAIISGLLLRLNKIEILRFVLHHNLKYIPVFGIYAYIQNFLFVNRENFNAESARKSTLYLKENSLKSWMVIFPEGTRYNPNKKKVIEKSDKFAESADLSKLKYHLTPRSKGIKILLDGMKDSVDYVCDITIVYGDENGRPMDRSVKTPGYLDMVEGKFTTHVHIDLLEVQSIPKDEKKFRNWLHERFLLKDKLYEELLDNNLDIPSVEETQSIMNKILKNTNEKENSNVILEKLSFVQAVIPFIIMNFCGCYIFFASGIIHQVVFLSLLSYLIMSLIYLHCFVK